MDTAVLERQASTLRAEVAGHNAAIRTHRKARSDAQRDLAQLKQKCRELGIELVIEPQHSEGAVHGNDDTGA